jgi:hypothetical protein
VTAELEALLTEALAKAEQATQAPWHINPKRNYIIESDDKKTVAETYGDLDAQDATFIADARTTNPAMARALLAVLRVLDGEIVTRRNADLADRDRAEDGESGNYFNGRADAYTNARELLHQAITAEFPEVAS